MEVIFIFDILIKLIEMILTDVVIKLLEMIYILEVLISFMKTF